MTALSGLVSVSIFAILAWWLQRKDESRYGAPTPGDRARTTVYAVCGFLVSLGFAYWGAIQYALITIFLVLIYQIIGVGVGKRGNCRQIRDGVFLGWVSGLPLTIIWLSDHANT